MGVGKVPVAVRHASRDVGHPAGLDEVGVAVDGHLEFAVEHHVDLLPRVTVRGRAGVGGAAGVEDLKRLSHTTGQATEPALQAVPAMCLAVGG